MKQIAKKVVLGFLILCILSSITWVAYKWHEKGTNTELSESSEAGNTSKAVTKLNAESVQLDEISGILIDKHCFDLKDPATDSKMCLNMKSCAASGYGIAIKQTDNTYKFLKFDNQGQDFAILILKNTVKSKNITIHVKGMIEGENIKVSSIVEE